MSAPSSFSLAALACLSIRVTRAMCLTLALCACGLSWVSEVRADAPQTMWSAATTTSSPWYQTKAAACGYFGLLAPTAQQNSIRCYDSSGAYKADLYSGTKCWDGTNPDTSKPLASQCSSPPPTCALTPGTVIPGDHYTVTSTTKLAAGVNFCTPATNCGLTASARVGGMNLTTGKWEYQFMGPLTVNGQVCTTNGTGADAPIQDAPIKCDAGMCTGTVNGVSICVKCVQTDNATAGTKTTTNPDGSTTQVGTTTSTTVNNNQVTTNTVTTTTTTPAGGGTPTTTTASAAATQSKDSYCQSNPNDSICKGAISQATGGDDCVRPPTCSGDAIQCMMVSQQWRTRCNLEKQSSLSDLGNAVAAGNDPNASSNPALDTNRTTIDLTGKIDQSTFLSGGLLQDQVMGAGNGHTITLPLSKLNQYLVILGNVFVAIALIGAAKIVTGGT